MGASQRASSASSTPSSVRPVGGAGGVASLIRTLPVAVNVTVPGKRLGSKARCVGRPLLAAVQASSLVLAAGTVLTPSSTTAYTWYVPFASPRVSQV